MADSRATLKVAFSIYGKDFKQEWWINWQDSDGRGMDSRVADWFEDCYTKAYAHYQRDITEYFAKQRAKETEDAERAELARLRAKYG